MAGVGFRPPVGIVDAVDVAQDSDVLVWEIVAVQRIGDDEFTSGFRPNPDDSPEEAEEAFAKDDPGAEIPEGDLPEDERRKLEASRNVKAEVEHMKVCASRQAVRTLRTDPRVEGVFVYPKRAYPECPQGGLDSGT